MCVLVSTLSPVPVAVCALHPAQSGVEWVVRQCVKLLFILMKMALYSEMFYEEISNTEEIHPSL